MWILKPIPQIESPMVHSFAAVAPTSTKRSTCRPSSPPRFNPDMKAKYAHLIETGKHAKVALIAIMRKLVVLPKGKSHLDPKNRLINMDTLD
jgi:hypothetical protein